MHNEKEQLLPPLRLEEDLDFWWSHFVKDSSGGGFCGKRILEYVRAHFLREILEQVASSPHLLQRICRRSYTHANAFDKIVLAYCPLSQLALRLHMWYRDVILIDEETNIHNHRWSFTSLLLNGDMKFEEFTLASEGQSLHHYRYQRSPARGPYRLYYQGGKILTTTRGGILQSGGCYDLNLETLHRVRPCTSFLSTLVLCGPPQRSWTDVFSNNIISSDEGEHLTRMVADVLSERISKMALSL